MVKTYEYITIQLGFEGFDYDYLVSKNIDDILNFVKPYLQVVEIYTVLSSGIDYAKDRISFNNSESGGRGASAKVRTLVGKGINQITYNKTTVDNIAFDLKMN